VNFIRRNIMKQLATTSGVGVT
jgi:ubiquinone biosynthesis O-methyltransferase